MNFFFELSFYRKTSTFLRFSSSRPTSMLIHHLLAGLLLICGAFAGGFYNESLYLKPLPGNTLLASFDFDLRSLPAPLTYYNGTNHDEVKYNHYNSFPKSLGPIIEVTNTRQLHLRFTQGWWDADSWGQLPANGLKSGGTGLEMWAVMEAPDYESAKTNWFKLAESLSGFFCASLNFIDATITTSPKFKTENSKSFVSNKQNKLFLLRAALPSEPICTENLTPFLKLLPVRGKAGISSLLDGHKVFDSLWHSMSIDIKTECESTDCNLVIHQSINSIIDISRSLRRYSEGGIPKPTPGANLRCDESKGPDIWKCFPLPDPTDLSWNLEKIYGRKIKGGAFADDDQSSVVTIEVDANHWDVKLEHLQDEGKTLTSLIDDKFKSKFTYVLAGESEFDLEFSSADTTNVTPVETPPLIASRSLTGYSLDQGGLRVSFKNPSTTESVSFIYFETLPWFVRLYLHTLTSEGNGEIVKRYYKPAIDRKRPSQLEFLIKIPPSGSLTLTYQFDKSLLLYAEYPPDANHGFSIEPAVITVMKDSEPQYQLRTTSLLLTLPTPDFSMPYNVIILTCTIMSLAFGTVFNLLTKKVITEEELEKLSGNSKAAKVVAKIKERVNFVKAKLRRTQ